MSISELELSPRGRGRAQKALSAEFVRELEPADLQLLASERGTRAPAIGRLRDRHHALARCLAQGMTNTEASAITGYDPSRISILRADPTFRDLVADYAKIEGGLQAEFQERAAILTLSAMDVIQEAVENDEDPMTPGMALEVAKTFADRTGHAPVQKNLNLNANLDLGSRLGAARARLRERLSTESVGDSQPSGLDIEGVEEVVNAGRPPPGPG